MQYPYFLRRLSLESGRVACLMSLLEREWGCNEEFFELGYDLVKTKENLHRCCLNGDRFRLPMCLIRREEEKGHHSQVMGEEEKPRGAGNHEAERLRTRLLTYMEP